MQSLGFIGLGLMGNPMVKRLLDKGYSVTVWNRSSSKIAPLLTYGAIEGASPQSVAEDVDVIMICVSDTVAVREVVFGDLGICYSNGKGKVLVDFSSIDPDSTREMADALAQRNGMDWVDCPVSGGVVGAESGQLALMAGGDSGWIEKLNAILSVLGRNITHMGPVGAGQVTKICNQMLVTSNIQMMAEVFALAERAGVDSRMIPAALAGGFADSLPLQITGPRMADREFEPVKWHVKTLRKDLKMASDLAYQTASPTPVATLLYELIQAHADQGNGDRDPATLINMYLENGREG